MLKRGLIGAGSTRETGSRYLGYCGDNAAVNSGSGTIKHIITTTSAYLGQDLPNRLVVVAVAGSFGDRPTVVTVGGVSATMVAGGGVPSNFGQVWAVSVAGTIGDISVFGASGVAFGFHWYAIYTDTPTPSATVDNNGSTSTTDISVYSDGITIGAISLRADSTMDDVTMDANGAVLTYGPIVSDNSTRFGYTWIALPTETAEPTTFNFSGVSDGGSKSIASWEQ